MHINEQSNINRDINFHTNEYSKKYAIIYLQLN